MENTLKPSSIKKERRKIQSDIKKLFDKSSRRLEKIILTFDQDHLKDENGDVGKALHSLRQLLAFGFD